MFRPQRVCLLGAECTGKTTLARALAQHFGGLWVPAYLRMFCDLQGRAPAAQEQSMVMRAQLEQEEQVMAQAVLAGNSYVFCDTAPLLTATYSDCYFADQSLYDAAHALHGSYALTLLLAPDMTWLPHDGDQARATVHTLLRHQLQSMRYPCIEVTGLGESRLQAAVLAVETLTC